MLRVVVVCMSALTWAHAVGVGDNHKDLNQLSNELQSFAELSPQEREQQMWEFLGSDQFQLMVQKFQHQDKAVQAQQSKMLQDFLADRPHIKDQVGRFHKFFSRDPDVISKEILEGMSSHMMQMQGALAPPMPALFPQQSQQQQPPHPPQHPPQTSQQPQRPQAPQQQPPSPPKRRARGPGVLAPHIPQ